MSDTSQNISYVAYLRKSTDDKENQVLSLETQSEVIKRIEIKYGIYIREVISEKQSAKKPGREGFNKMIKLIRDRKAQGIVVWSAHRLSRNAHDTAQLISLFDDKVLKEIITDSYTFQNSPMDVFMLGFHCAQAKLENDCKAIDVKKGMETCASKGIFPSKPPLGYLTDPHGIKGNRKRDIDPIRFPLVRKLWEEMLTAKYTPKQIWKKATEVWNLRNGNGQLISLSNIYKILHNPFYYGEFIWPQTNGKLYKGIHTPMISKEDFQKVQILLNKKGPPRPIHKFFTYGGCVFHCGECGGAISGYNRIKTQKNGNVHKYIYYQCTKYNIECTQKGIKEEHIESQVIQLLKNITIPKIFYSLIISALKLDKEEFLLEAESKTINTKIAYQNTLKKIDGLIDLRSRDQISEEQFERIKSQTEKESQRLYQQLYNVKFQEIDLDLFINKALQFCSLALKKFQEGSPEVKRGIVSNLGSNLSIIHKNIDITKENWILPFKSLAEKIKEDDTNLEPNLSLENKGSLSFFHRNSLLCSLVKDVRTCFLKNPNREWFKVVDEWVKEDKLKSA